MNSTKNKFQQQNLQSQEQLYQQSRQRQQKEDKKTNNDKQNNIKHSNIQTTQLTESKINTLYKILTLNKESKKQNNNNKLQDIFQKICNLDMNQKKRNSQIVQNFVKYAKENIKNGQIILSDVKYKKYFQSYVFGHIRQPNPNQLFILQQKQIKQEKLYEQSKTQQRQQVPEIQTVQKSMNTKKLQEILTKIEKQITKQTSRSPNLKQILKQLFVLFEQMHKSYEKKQLNNSIIHLWKLFSNNNNYYFRHLLFIILSFYDTNKQLSQDIIIQGWLCDFSRKDIIQIIIEQSQCKNQKSNINISLLCCIIDRKICGSNSSDINNAFNDWHFIKQLYLSGSTQYSKYQIKQFMRTYSNDKYTQIQEFVNHLSPEWIVLLSQQMKLHSQYTNIIEQINNNDNQNSNINYLYYLLENNTEDSKHLSTYIQKQQQIIKEQVINNSYPTQELISNSFMSLTNIIYQLNKNHFNQQNISHRTLIIKIIKQFHKSLQELYSNMSTIKSKDNILNCQRLHLYYEFVGQQLPVLCEKFITFYVNQISNPIASIFGLYNLLRICNYILSNQSHNKLDLILPLSAIENLNNIIIHKSTNELKQEKQHQKTNKLKQEKQHQKQAQIGLICIQLLKYLTILPTQYLKTSTQKYKQIIISLQKILYNTNYNKNILYSNKLIQIILLSSQKFNLISQSGQFYFLQFIDRTQEADKLMLNFNKQQWNRNLITVASSALQFSLAISRPRLRGLDKNNNTEKIPPIINELIIRKSQTITQCMNLLTRKQDQIDKLSKFLSFIGYQNSPQQKIYNLHQYDNIAIKYCQITEHNTESRQPVFYSDMYRNHSNMYIYFQTFKLYLNTLHKLENPPKKILQKISTHIIQSIKYIKTIQSKVTHNSAQFYHLLNIWKFIYCSSYYQDIAHLLIFDFSSLVQFNMDNCCWILEEILQIFQLGNIHPLIRQYASLILSLFYRSIDRYNTSNQQCTKIKKLIKKRWREQLLQKLNPKNNVVNINVFVPIIFTLGYEMISNTKNIHQKYLQNYLFQLNQEKQYEEVVDTLIRYISCHHAYIRSLAQYYIMKKIQIQKQVQSQNNKTLQKSQQFMKKNQQNSLVEYLCEHVWKKDRDCIKIMRNVGIGVQGFREAMENAQSIQFLGYERVQQYPSQIVLYQFRLDYFRVLQQFYRLNQKQLSKSRLKLFKEGQILFDESSNQELNYLSTASKMIQQKLQKLHTYLQHPQTPLILQYRRPQIIIIASLLQKVHNFGYILRTLHEKRAMLLIPSKQLIQHPECQQFIPKNSQIQVIEIKQNQLDSFIKLNKKIGYPLIGLEQCAGSVKIQQYSFPNQYMLLLGNEKIGAPASLLNQADVLVEIPQVGKVRSLNVHVSMVICLWQSIIKNIGNKKIN